MAGRGEELFKQWKALCDQGKLLEKKWKELDDREKDPEQQSQEIKAANTVDKQNVEKDNEALQEKLAALMKDSIIPFLKDANLADQETAKLFFRSEKKLSDEEKKNEYVVNYRDDVRAFFKLLVSEKDVNGKYGTLRFFFKDNLSWIIRNKLSAEEGPKISQLSGNYEKYLGLLEEELGIDVKKEEQRYDEIDAKTGRPSEFCTNIGMMQMDPDVRIRAMEKAMEMLDKEEKEATQQLKEGKRFYPYVPTEMPTDSREFARQKIMRNYIRTEKGSVVFLNNGTLSNLLVLLRCGWKDQLDRCADIPDEMRENLKREWQSDRNPVGPSGSKGNENAYPNLLKELRHYENRIETLKRLKERYPQYEQALSGIQRANEWIYKIRKEKAFKENGTATPFRIGFYSQHEHKRHLDPLARLSEEFLHRGGGLEKMGETAVGMAHEDYLQMTRLAEKELPFGSYRENETDRETSASDQSAASVSPTWDQETQGRINQAVAELSKKVEDADNPEILAWIVGDYWNCVDALVECRFKHKAVNGPSSRIVAASFAPSTYGGLGFKNVPQTLEEQIEILSRVMQEKILNMDENTFNRLTEGEGCFAVFQGQKKIVLTPEQLHEHRELIRKNLANFHKYGLRIRDNQKMDKYRKIAERIEEKLRTAFQTKNQKEPTEQEAEEIRRIALWQVMSQSEDMKNYTEAYKILSGTNGLYKYEPAIKKGDGDLFYIISKGVQTMSKPLDLCIQDNHQPLQEQFSLVEKNLTDVQSWIQKAREWPPSFWDLYQVMTFLNRDIRNCIEAIWCSLCEIQPQQDLWTRWQQAGDRWVQRKQELEHLYAHQMVRTESFQTEKAEAVAALFEPTPEKQRYPLKKEEWEKKVEERSRPVPPPKGTKTFSDDKLCCVPNKISFKVLYNNENSLRRKYLEYREYRNGGVNKVVLNDKNTLRGQYRGTEYRNWKKSERGYKYVNEHGYKYINMSETRSAKV